MSNTAEKSDVYGVNYAEVLPKIRDVALEAGKILMKYYESGVEADQKSDGSPVTAADMEADAYIFAQLKEITPHIPIVTEETQEEEDYDPDISGGVFWLVDPLDGTKEFIHQRGDFTVNIALIEHGVPTMGVVYAPAVGELFTAAGPESATFTGTDGVVHDIRVRPIPQEGVTVVSSRSHGDPAALDRFLKGRKVAAEVKRGSSLKLCLVAKGEADFYPRFGPTCEWDVAAGHAIVLGAGGSVVQLEDGAPFTYGHKGRKFLNPFFLVSGSSNA